MLINYFKLKKGAKNMSCNCNKIIEMQVENENLIKVMDGIIVKIQNENERLNKMIKEVVYKLKKENESLKNKIKELESNIEHIKIMSKINQEENKKLRKENEELKSKNYNLIMQNHLELSKKLFEEGMDCIESQTESMRSIQRNPHKCPVCDGSGEIIYNASGFMSTDYHTLLSRLIKINDSGQMFLRCKACKGTGIFLECK